MNEWRAQISRISLSTNTYNKNTYTQTDLHSSYSQAPSFRWHQTFSSFWENQDMIILRISESLPSWEEHSSGCIYCWQVSQKLAWKQRLPMDKKEACYRLLPATELGFEDSCSMLPSIFLKKLLKQKRKLTSHSHAQVLEKMPLGETGCFTLGGTELLCKSRTYCISICPLFCLQSRFDIFWCIVLCSYATQSYANSPASKGQIWHGSRFMFTSEFTLSTHYRPVIIEHVIRDHFSNQRKVVQY